jgi:S1-C subfamily serine protease
VCSSRFPIKRGKGKEKRKEEEPDFLPLSSLVLSLIPNKPSPKVYVSEPGYSWSRANVPKHAIITALNHRETPTFEKFVQAISSIKHGEQVRGPVPDDDFSSLCTYFLLLWLGPG